LPTPDGWVIKEYDKVGDVKLYSVELWCYGGKAKTMLVTGQALKELRAEISKIEETL
jgi:hypothetical protein